MAAADDGPSVLLAAGGTGGHLFPAEALAVALGRRGIVVDLATDERAARYGGSFPARATYVIASDTLRRNPFAIARTVWRLGSGFGRSHALLGAGRPAAVIGFGGYPSIPPLMAAMLRRIPTIIHEQNGVMGRANRMLSRRVTAIATSFPGVLDATPELSAKATHTGNPLRPAVLAAARTAYDEPVRHGRLKLVVTGGSQGARVMADIVPAAIAALPVSSRMRIAVDQQAREEDLARVRAVYREAGVDAEVAPFFTDLPARLARAHLVIARAGASSVAEFAAIGRPSILVPLPNALDQDQMANARVLKRVGGAILLPQDVFTSERLTEELADIAAAPERLAEMAAGARTAGTLDAADRLADLVMRVANVVPRSR